MVVFEDYSDSVYLTINEVARRKILTESALRRLEKEHRLPAIKVGNRTLINVKMLIEQLPIICPEEVEQ